MMKFNDKTGTLNIEGTPFENGKIEFNLTQFRCNSTDF